MVRVPGYRSRSPGSIPGSTRFFWQVVGLERGPLSLVSAIEELLERKSSGFGLESRDPSRWPRGTLYPQKLALTLSTSGGRSLVRYSSFADSDHGAECLEHYPALICFTLKWAGVAEWGSRMSRCLITDLTEPGAAQSRGRSSQGWAKRVGSGENDSELAIKEKQRKDVKVNPLWIWLPASPIIKYSIIPCFVWEKKCASRLWAIAAPIMKKETTISFETLMLTCHITPWQLKNTKNAWSYATDNTKVN
jgi:hypothetical protein